MNILVYRIQAWFMHIQAYSGRFRQLSLSSILTSKMDSQTPKTYILIYVMVCYAKKNDAGKFRQFQAYLGLLIQIKAVWHGVGFDIKNWFLVLK